MLERTIPRTRYILAFVHFKDDNGEDVFVIKRVIYSSRDWRPGKPPPK